MPSMADIVIKKADGTTDITLNALTPSSGDKSKAIWREESVGTVQANRPMAECAARLSQNQKFRVVDVRFAYPETYTDSTTGLVRVRDRDLFTGTFNLAVDNNDATNNEFAAQSVNWLKSALMQMVLKSGFAPT